MMDSTYKHPAILVVMAGLLAVLASSGCAPELDINSCETNQDCFPGEVCTAQGFCSLAGESDGGIDAGADTSGDTGFDTQGDGTTVDGGADADVDMPVINAIELSPATADVAVGLSVELSATAVDADNNEVDGAEFRWSSSDESILTVSETGQVTGVALGSATVTVVAVSDPSIDATAEVTVVPGEVDEVVVEPADQSVTVGATLQFMATAYNAGDRIIADPQILWSVGDDTLADIDPDGLVDALQAGTTTVIANVEGVEGQAALTIEPTPIDRIEITPEAPVIEIGETVDLSATVYDTNDQEITDVMVEWTSDSAAASVDDSGLVSGESDGNAIITAQAGGVSDTVTVEVNGPNAAPVVDAGVDQSVTVGQMVALDATGTQDADGDTLYYTWSFADKPTNSTAALNDPGIPEPTFTADEAGQYRLELSVNDGDTTVVDTVVITAVPDEAPEVDAGDDAAVEVDQSLTLQGTATDTEDVDTDLTVGWMVTQKPNGAAVVLSADNTRQVGFQADTVGEYELTLSATDSQGQTSTDIVIITVNPANQAPTAVDDTPTVVQGQTQQIDVLDNDTDPDPGDTLTITAVDDGSTNGTATITNGGADIEYTAPATGSQDTFGYTIEDGNGHTATATVTVTLQTPNQAPTAADDTPTAVQGETKTIDVLANDTDPDPSDTLTITAVDDASTNGTVTITNGGADIEYTAPATGTTDTFGYTIEDGNGHTATATVTVTLQTPNQAPTAADDTPTVVQGQTKTIDVLANDTDPDPSDTLTITAVDGASTNGTATITNGGADIEYTAPATGTTDTFGYTIEDGNGHTATATVTVTLQTP